jgi:hypothetical protein
VGIVEEARAARDAGAPWRARDLLAEHVERQRDPEALALLGDVLHEMGDLPRAGAIWFAAGATGPEVDSAVAAWREQSHDDFAVMWRSLPASVQAEPRPRRVEALRARAIAAGADVDASSGPPDDRSADVPADGDADILGGRHDEDESHEGGRDAAWLVAWILAVAFVVFAVIGFVTALGWLVPG